MSQFFFVKGSKTISIFIIKQVVCHPDFEILSLERGETVLVELSVCKFSLKRRVTLL